ncbi:DUF3822 family protein [Sphingobacterium psychroaquaticum]|nr:DUF3822 family protein [Sphingobacterium psychroaquaticum]QBQ41857.1 DUF3822 family protein [Sphingobacterium psychroaquaticum]
MNYTSKNFQLHYLPSYKLLVKTDFINDTLLVLNAANEVEVLYSYPADMPDGEAVKLLGLPFQQVYINLPVQSLIFVPTEVFEEADKKHYQDFLLDDKSERTNFLSIAALEATACYQYDLLLHNRWRKIFPEAKFGTDFQTVLSQVQSFIPAAGTLVGVHVRDCQADIYAFVDNQFQMYSTFEANVAGDLHYFILNTLKQVGTEGVADRLIVSGITKDDVRATGLVAYGKELHFMETRTAVRYPSALPSSQIEVLNTLIDAHLCE